LHSTTDKAKGLRFWNQMNKKLNTAVSTALQSYALFICIRQVAAPLLCVYRKF